MHMDVGSDAAQVRRDELFSHEGKWRSLTRFDSLQSYERYSSTLVKVKPLTEVTIALAN